MITLSEATELAKKYRVIPVIQSLFSGSETPVSIFEKLASSNPGSFLLESAEQGVWSRYSFIGVHNLGFLYSTGQKLKWESTSDAPILPIRNSGVENLTTFAALAKIQRSWVAAPVAELPPLVSGMVGLMSWDSIQQLEVLQPPKPKDFQVPEIAMALIQDMVVVDHFDSSLKFVSNIYVHEDSDIQVEHEQAVARIEAMKLGLLNPSKPFIADVDFNQNPQFDRQSTDTEFLDMISKAKKHVVAGDVFQVVLSQRFEMNVEASALDVYRSLRALNPSPYMYLLNFFDEHGEFSVVGSSPEALVRVKDGQAVLHPIAGSRPRGTSPDHDGALAAELFSDEKEKAEHLMLVDLARNDLLKVCKPNSVAVTEFMAVERYSHIMHLVSTVEGELLGDVNAVDVVRATFPAGTLSGAPKPRALELIEELEPINRGLFGGVVGYFDFAGNADLAIAIRTAVLRNGRAVVQAGAGIVLDSDPIAENLETLSKASAPLRAIQAANTMQRLSK